MKFEHYLNRLKESEEFSKFKEKNPQAKLAAGFFVLDFEAGQNVHQIDFSLPNKKVATFLLDEGVKIKISEQTIKKKLPEIKAKPKTDIDALKGIVEDAMKNRTVTENIRKMIAILHIMDNKLIWNIQCILDGMGILLVHVDDSDQTVLKFEKHSLMELIKPGSLQIMPKGKESEGEGKQLEILKKSEPVQEPKSGTEIPESEPGKLKNFLEQLQKQLKIKKASAGKSKKKPVKKKKK